MLYGNIKTYSYFTNSINDSVSQCSSSVSPQNPEIKSDVNATSKRRKINKLHIFTSQKLSNNKDNA